MTDRPTDDVERDAAGSLPTLPRRNAQHAGTPVADEEWPAPSRTVRRALLMLSLVMGLALTAVATHVVLTTPGPLGPAAGPDSSDVPVAVGGTDGLYPGGPAGTAELAFTNATSATLIVTTVQLDLGALPAGCPAAAWSVGDPIGLPTVRAGADGSVPVPVSLLPDAPASCASRVVTWSASLAAVDPAGHSERLSGVGSVTTATLGSPGVSVQLRAGHPAVTPLAPSGGPAPVRYEVDVVRAGAPPVPLCRVSAPTECLDRDTPGGTPRRYVVTAVLSARWVRSSAAVQLDGTER